MEGNSNLRGRKRITVEELLNDPRNFKALLLAGLGMSDRYIEKNTGLTKAMIASRVRIAGIRRKFYRDGESMIAQRVIDTTERYASSAIKGQLIEMDSQPPTTAKKGS